MKRLLIILAGIGVIGVVAFVAFAQNSQTKEEYCTAQRKRCVQNYTVTNSHGVVMVTPEGTKLCWGQYRKCMGKK
jgi:hypothetical protein